MINISKKKNHSLNIYVPQYALLPLILKMYFTRERLENKLHIKRFFAFHLMWLDDVSDVFSV